jgi:hypothetical protein
MAELDQSAGALDLRCVRGDDLVFTATIAGDYSGYTHVCRIYDGDALKFSIVPVAVFSAPNSVITFTIPDSITSQLLGTYRWTYNQTLAETTRTILAGDFEVVR